VKPEEMFIARQRLGKQVYVATYTQATIEELWERSFLFGPCKIVIKKSSVENRLSSSGAPSEHLVESWALQGRLRRWFYMFSLQSGCQEKCLRVL
jgi:hypothetical protein